MVLVEGCQEAILKEAKRGEMDKVYQVHKNWAQSRLWSDEIQICNF